MKLSELKALRPDVWEVFKIEVIKQHSELKWDELIDGDYLLLQSCNWFITSQGGDMWAKIHYDSDFTLFDKWMEENRPKESEPESLSEFDSFAKAAFEEFKKEPEKPVKHITPEDYLYLRGISSDTTVGIEGDILLTDIMEGYLNYPKISQEKVKSILKSLGK